jgi:Cu(I)/Ag(I) efflux system periplasmic protein CusF
MKRLILLVSLTFAQFALATAPPAGFPIVKGEVRKIDAASNRLSIKHEAIPNLDMPGMTMSFQVQDAKYLTGLIVGDKIEFAADEVDGEITVLWLRKATSQVQVATEILCKGVAPTSPKTNVEIEVRLEKFSTIRYEFAEGPYKGTAYINSIGRMVPQQEGDLVKAYSQQLFLLNEMEMK